VKAIQQQFGSDLTVSVHFISEMNSRRTDQEIVMPKVKNIIAIVSGKGGVGKSTVATNFALALAADGAKVGLMDADIYGPSQHIMFGVRGERPLMKTVDGKGMIVPLEKYGIRLMSIGLLVDEKNAVVWRGPMASSAIKQFVTEVLWDELDYLVIDMPPGTGDIHLTLLQSVPVTGVIVVTTPQDVALADAKKAIAMFGQAQLKAPIIGLVENMSYFVGAEAPEHRYYIFGKDGGKRLAEEYDIPFLGQIPLVQEIREGGDEGKPVMIGEDNSAKKAFQDFAGNAARSIAMINANINTETRAGLVVA
jgi:ATP-binding protein involved in chromosome partitioning